jgi:hypothetical protein
MATPEYVRVTDDSGEAYSVVAGHVEDAMTVLKDEPAADGNGDPLPHAPHTKAAAKKAAAVEGGK